MTPHWTELFSRPILFLVVALIGAGAYLAFTLPVSVFPDTDFPRIVVGIDNGVAPIDQMQVTVTRPIEEALNAVPGLEQVRSTSSRGSAEVNLFFNWNVDMRQTLQSVNAALAQAQTTLPSTVRMTAHRLTFAAFPVLGYSLTSDTMPQTALWELANYVVKPRLSRVNGVASVVVQGGQVPEFQIEPDPGKMLAAQVTPSSILDAVAKTNIIDSPGLMEDHHELSLVLVSGQATKVSAIANMVVRMAPNGVPVRVGDIAVVRPSVMPVYTMVTANGRPAVLLNVFRQPLGNTVAVADAAGKELASIRSALPSGVRLQAFYDQSELVRDSIASVRDAILIGLVLATVILILFLRDWGSALVAALVIPAALAITLVVMRLLGESLNLMTLGGLAAAVGLVIDDAIVMVENIVLHRVSGQSRGEAIRSALHEITLPLFGSTLTPIVVFLPLTLIAGVTGSFFRALALTIGAALLTSLALALTWVPALSHFLLHRTPTDRHRETVPAEPPLPMSKPHSRSRITAIHERALRFVLDYPLAFAGGCALLITSSFFCYKALGSDLLPEMDEGGFVIDYLMPAGSSLADTNAILLGVEKILADTPEVETTSRRTGLQLGLAAVTEANTGDFSVKLKPSRRRGIQQIISEVRAKVTRAYPTLDVEFIQVLQDLIGDLTSSPEPIEIKLFAQDPALLSEWAPRVADSVKKIPGVTDVKNGIENTISGPAIVMTVDPVVAARSGFSAQELELDASMLLQGEPASPPAIVNDRPYTIRVRYPDRTRIDLDSIRSVVLTSSSGRTGSLGTLATIANEVGQTEIQRENLLRLVTVTGRFEGVSLGQGITAVQKTVKSLRVPIAIRVAYGGTYQEQRKSFHDLLLVLGLAIALVFTVLLFEFRTFSAPAAIVSSALLSTSGVVFALFLTGTTFNISSFMGLIMVVGIVAKNGILLLDAEERFRKNGYSARDAMIAAGTRRLRPIMMTALATVAGMLPLSLAIGAGSQMLQPLAIAVIGGVSASLVLSLLVTPTVHYYLSEIG